MPALSRELQELADAVRRFETEDREECTDDAKRERAENARIASIKPTGVVRKPASLEQILGTAFVR
jgi:hypothetical protein